VLTVRDRRTNSSAPLSVREKIKGRVPYVLLFIYRVFRMVEIASVCSFLLSKSGRAKLSERWKIVRELYRITYTVPCFHTQSEIIAPIKAMLEVPFELRGVVVEAGCFKGGGTAKLSVAARRAGRELFVFDSFDGIPENSEPHDKNIWGGHVSFSKGDYRGEFAEVTDNVREFGDIEVCHFVKGFFDETMPYFRHPVVVAYLDVDLASSTRTCLKHLWPLLVPGGTLFSQDGHLPLVLKVFDDDEFWSRELNTKKPRLHGFGTSQLVWCRKGVDQGSPPATPPISLANKGGAIKMRAPNKCGSNL
jgi:O-methyltransferase